MEEWEVSHNGKYRIYPGKALLYRKGIAGDLRYQQATVYELLKKNEFRWIQIGTKYRISKKSFDEWLDQKAEKI